jgi:hypothetical protein
MLNGKAITNQMNLRLLALTITAIWANSLIMNKAKYSPKAIEKFLKRWKIATLAQLITAMDNPARSTIFRKLEQLEYLSSYSHRGKYYTLRSIARFNRLGLWDYRSVHFSRFGNLLDTAQAFIHDSEAGYTATELKDVLHVKTKHALTQLYRSGRIQRDRFFDSVYVYLSIEDPIADRQRKARKIHHKRSSASLIVANPDLAGEEAKAIILLFCSMLDERQRRMYAGLESLKLGYGGDTHIASLLGMDPQTVARGRNELMGGKLDNDRVREKGGGRLAQEKKRPKS